jgi:hypothetical protein
MEISTGTGLVILGVLYLITHVGKEWIMGQRTERMFARRLETELEAARIGATTGAAGRLLDGREHNEFPTKEKP